MKKIKLLLALCLSGSMSYAQIITTVAGNGTSGNTGNGGQATAASLTSAALATDVSGNLYTPLRKIKITTGIISAFAGNGTYGTTGDGGQATNAEFENVSGIAADASGNVYISDFYAQRVRKINTSGIISTFAGTGTAGFSGDGGAAASAKLYDPDGIVVDASGNVYIADASNNRIRKVNTSGIISTFAGTGSSGFSGDGGQASAANINVGPLAIDASGNIYIADAGTYRVRKINTSGIITTVAGNGTWGYSGDGGQATSAQLTIPYALAVASWGTLYIADQRNNVVRAVYTNGIIETIAGNGIQGYSGDGGQATAAELNWPNGLAIDANSNLYISDDNNYRIRKVPINSSIPTLCDASIERLSLTNYTSCTGITIPTTSVSGFNYTWAPTTALSCTNCIQPVCTYSNTTTPIIYTVTVGANGCISVTATVQVTAVTPVLTATLVSASATVGSNITAVGTYSGTTTPNNYYWEIVQCDQFGTTTPGGYNWSGWTAGAPTGTYTFANTSTLTCNTYYKIGYAVQNTNVCLGWEPAPGIIAQVKLPANAGSNKIVINPGSCCSGIPVVIGTPAVPNMTYSWAPSTLLTPSTSTAQPTSSWSNTSTCQIYTLTISATGCTPATSTVQVCAQAHPGASCCKIAAGIDTENEPEIGLTIYPNPSNGDITISLSNKAKYIYITDMLGRVVLETKNINAGELKLDLSRYNKSVYFITAKTGDVIERQKLIIE